MKTQFLTIFALLAAGAAYAGFLHPIEQNTEEAIAIQHSRPAAPSLAAPAKPSQKSAPGESGTGPVSWLQRFLPSFVKPAPKAASGQPATPPSSVTYGPALPPPAQRQPAAAPAAQALPPNPARNAASGGSFWSGPVPKSPALPSASNIRVPEVHLPGGDGRLPMAATPKPGSLGLQGVNRAQIHSFLRQARALRLPERTYGTEVRSLEIANRFAPALHPTPYRSFRTAYTLSLAKILRITNPPSPVQYENMVKRMDALFLGLDFYYPRAVLSLWQLSESESNPKPLQARDALFAGILSERAGWEIAASNLYESSAQKRVDQQGRYLRILWQQLERLGSASQVDRVIAQVNPQHALQLAQEGDKANLSIAKRLFASQTKESLAASREFEKRIQGKDSREGLQILRLVAQLRSQKEDERKSAMASLREIEASGEPARQEQSRLALARTLLQHGSPLEALDLYRRVKKDGKNRLEVTAEQTYAEYMTGNYQDSLGKTMGLQSPYFQYGFAPDVHLVEILSRKAVCDFGGAEAGVKRFAERYSGELAALESLLSEKKAPAAFYEELIGYAALEKPMRFQRYLLHNNAVMENQKTMNEALAGLQTIDDLGLRHHSGVTRPEGWDAFAQAMRSRWDRRAQDLRKDSASAALAEAEYMAKRLRATFAQVELLDLDVSMAASKNYNLQSAMNFPVRRIEEEKQERDKMRWSFQDEVWEDELDFLKMKNPSKCALSASTK